MITDKDSEELRELTRQIRSTKMDVVFFDYGWNECAEIIMRYVNKKCTESADQARKEAVERVTCAWREHGEDITLRMLRDAILDDSTADHIPDTGKKLTIAVKALEYVTSKSLPSSVFESHYSRLQDACAKASDALKEIQ